MSQQLPSPQEVIRKIKTMQPLTPEEELVYLVHIEHIDEAVAKMIIEKGDDADTSS